MNTNGIYVDVLLTSLRKKVSILEQLETVVMDQERALKNKNVDIEELDQLDIKKGELLEELNDADEGFEQVYERVKEEIANQKYQYEAQIKEMQQLIKVITDLTVKLQAQEVRNKQWAEIYFQSKKNEVRIFRKGSKSTVKYTNNMANRQMGQSYFLDKKK